MKKKFLLLIATSFLALFSVAQVPNYVPANGLVGWWPFTGNTIDSSGNGNNGTNNGATLTTDRFGISNRAYSFNGTSNWIYVANSTSLNTQNFNGITLSGWAKTASISTGNPPQAMVNFTQGNNLNINYVFDYSSIGGLELTNWNLVSAAVNIPSPTNISVNTWYFIAVTSDFTTNTSKLYINGLLWGQSGNILVKPVSPVLSFGRHGPTGVWWLNGALDDIGAWNRALSSQEISALYSGCNNSFTTQPSNKTAPTGSSPQFNAISNGSTPNYQWQSNSNNLGWTNIPTNSFYSGGTTNTLTVNSVQVSNNQQKFRVIATSGNCLDTSSIATLSITDTCLNVKFISVTDTLIINAKLTGISPPNNYNLVKVYPNPAKSHIIIDCGNYVSMSGYKLTIENSIGQQVFFSIITKQQYDIALTAWTGMGLYFLKITDASNNLVEVKKIILQ